MDKRNIIERYLEQQLQINHKLMKVKAGWNQKDLFSPRFLLEDIKQDIADFLSDKPTDVRWLVLPGLRGVGKTTLLSQLYLSIVQNKNSSKQTKLLYLSLDEPVVKFGVNLAEILDVYQIMTGGSWLNSDSLYFILIDEVQADPNWAKFIKFVYDKTDNVFFVCTGSSATALQMTADIDGRRAKVVKVYPLSFIEHQALIGLPPNIGLKQSLIETIYHSASVEDVYQGLIQKAEDLNRQWRKYDSLSFEDYLRVGTMPNNLVFDNRLTFYTNIQNIIRRVVVEDIMTIRKFDFQTTATIQRLLFLLADSQDTVSFTTLNKILGTNNRLLWRILDALVEAELLIKVPAWGNHFQSTRKPVRYHFQTPAIRASYYNLSIAPANRNKQTGKLLEDLAALHYLREIHNKNQGQLTYYYDKAQSANCDFILKLIDGRQLAIEFGLGKKDVGQVVKTMEEVDCSYGLVFADQPLAINRDAKVVTIPLKYFLLM